MCSRPLIQVLYIWYHNITKHQAGFIVLKLSAAAVASMEGRVIFFAGLRCIDLRLARCTATLLAPGHHMLEDAHTVRIVYAQDLM